MNEFVGIMRVQKTDMKITDLTIGQVIYGDTGGIGISERTILEINITNKSVTVESYTGKIDVFEKEFLEYFLCEKID